MRALLAAQRRSAWNRMRAESGLSGTVATAATLGTVAAVLAVPGVLTFRAGSALGAGLVDGAALPALQWNALQALFTAGFAVLGSLRYRPSFRFADFGRLPIPPFELLLAEVPAALFEVFPLLAMAGILCSSLGLAVVAPAWSPLVAVLAVQGLATMVALLFLAASLRRIAEGHRRTACFLVAAVLVLAAADWQTVRGGIVARGPGLLGWLPGSQGYAALSDLAGGHLLGGGLRLGAALSSTALLLVCAVWVHDRVQHRAAGAVRRGGGQRRARSRFGGPAAAVGRLFFRQLLDSKSGKVLLIAPLTFTVPLAVLAAAVRFDTAGRNVLPEAISRAFARIEDAPLFVLLVLLCVLLDSQVWMNQFGWDRAGVRTLLLLPMPRRTLPAGKARGLLRFVALQAALGALPLLLIRGPSAAETVAGIGAGGTALVAAAAFGQWLSVRYPRPVPRDGSAAIPLYLAWIPTVFVAAVAAGLRLLGGAVAGLGDVAAGAVFVALLAVSVGLYRQALDRLEDRLRACRERLLRL